MRAGAGQRAGSNRAAFILAGIAEKGGPIRRRLRSYAHCAVPSSMAAPCHLPQVRRLVKLLLAQY
ncbi:hypothetical protein BD413DRAFT_551708 [Trametes elegans]|nr:hypothetical protein BD413DRAFT_551708 [Trametes elegans]